MSFLAVITASTSIAGKLGAKNLPRGSHKKVWKAKIVTHEAKLGDSEIKIDTGKSLTLVFKDPKITEDLSYKNSVRLDFETAIKHINSIMGFHPETEELVRKVFPHYNKNWNLHWINTNEGAGFRHVTGRIDFTLRAQDAGISFVWVYPEASLHQSTQLNLADVLLLLLKRGQGKHHPPFSMNRKPKVPL